MAYASGEKRNGNSSVGAPGPPGASSSPCPPSQPRKGTSSRPVLSARSSTSANGSQAASGPLVASALGGNYPYHSRNASPGPQRNASSPQHISSHRSTSASLQRSTSSSRQRNSHGQVPGKPFFTAYGLQYSSNGRNSASMGTRASANMSPYRNRPSSSTGPPSTSVGAAAASGRPSTSQAAQRASGDNWFGNTKLSVTLPNEAAHAAQELLSIGSPLSPSSVPPGVKAPGSFRASKYTGGAGGSASAHKEAWGSGGGSMEMGMGAGGNGLLLRPNSAASSTGSASKPIMAPYMGDGRHGHGQGANLSLMRLQQQQQSLQVMQQPLQQQQQQMVAQQHQHQGMYGTTGTGGMLPTATSVPPPGGAQYQHSSFGSQTGVPGTGPYLHTAYINFQSASSSYQPQSSSGGGSSNAGGMQPPRLNLTMVGGGSPTSSPKDPGPGQGSTSPGTSPHGVPPPGYPPSHIYAQPYPHAPSGPRPWDSHPSSGGGGYLQPAHAHANGPAYLGMGGPAQQSQLVSPRPSGTSSSSGFHYLPSVDGVGSAPVTASGAATGYTTMTVAASGAPTYSQSSSLSGTGATQPTFASTASASMPYNSSMAAAAAAAMAMGTHPPPHPLPVPTSAGPVPVAPPSSLALPTHSTPLHLSVQAASVTTANAAATATPFGSSSNPAGLGGVGMSAVSFSPAAKAMRETLLATTSGNSISGNVSSPSPSSSSSQVQPAPPASSFTSAPSGSSTAASALGAPRSSSLANAPLPVGLPPPSPLKVAPPSGAPFSRGGFIRSNSSRSSNGSGYDNGPYYNSILATVQDSEREELANNGGTLASAAQQTSQTPVRQVYASSDGATSMAGTAINAPLPGAATSPGFTTTPNTGSGSGAHVTWGATVTQTSTPSTPTRMQNYSFSDLAARRVSMSSGLGVQDMSSPFARGSDNHSRMLVEHGTLTCVRPSTVPSNFAADSQTDLAAYGDPQSSVLPGAGSDTQGSGGMYGISGAAAPTSQSAAQTWSPSPLAAATTAPSSYGQVAAGSGAASTSQQPWRRSTEDAEPSGGSGSVSQQQQPQQQANEAGGAQATSALSLAAQAASAGTTSRDDGAWGRSRDSTPARTYGVSMLHQQQQGGSKQTTVVETVAASAAVAAVAAVSEAHAHTAAQRAVSGGGAAAQSSSAAEPSSAAIAGSSSASTTSQQAAAPLSGLAGVPLPADQPLRPKVVSSAISPRYSPWSDAPTSKPQSATTPTPSTPAAPAPASSSAAAAASSGTSSTSPPAAGASSSPAGSAAGSAASSGSTSSGTVSSGYTISGSGSGVSALSSSGPHTSAVRRSSSIVTRFNPATVLGSEPDPVFGNLLPGYSVGKVIGEGGFCQVRLAVHHLSQRKVAVKVIDRAKLVDPNEAKRMQREIRVMKHLSHQCVIKLFEVVESPRHLFLVMEHAPSGSLLDYVRARKRLPEADACLFFQQIVASLEYCHSREVVHRDIKLENILLDADQRMKLIDFGLSAFFVPGKRLRVHCGSPSYAAPEIVARKAYEGPPVDVWSLGVVLFAMVAGYLPFHASGGNKQELCNKIIAGQYTAPEWLSSSMKDLLSRMLTTDPEKRITFPQVWQHGWVRNGPQWHERGINCYEVPADPSAPGGLRCDEQVVSELEAAGYARSTLTQHLAAGEATHLTASYYLLCEAKADALRRLRGSSSTTRGRSSGSSSASVRSSSVTASATMYGSAQLVAAVAKARTADSPGRGSGASGSRPSTAVAAGYPSARSHRGGGHQGEDMAMAGAGRMAVAV